MDVQQKDLSYFRLRLQELLNSSFPEKAHDQKFIDQRSSWAANAYEGAFRSGNALEQCNEIANYILFEGLHFSKFDTVFKVVCNSPGWRSKCCFNIPSWYVKECSKDTERMKLTYQVL